MNINSQTLRALYVSFSAAYKGAFDGVQSDYKSVAMTVPSTTKVQQYGWANAFPKMREWIGDRVINNISTSDFAITNKAYESTVGVDRDDIDDDNLGIYPSMFASMGQQAATLPDELVWPLLNAGFTTPRYDKQNFFDTDHPVINESGAVQSVSNSGGGTGTPWFLIDNTKVFRPLVHQTRRPFDLVAKDDPRDENVFMRKQFVYGVDGRCAVGFGLWQLAYGSKQPLNAANYAAARAAMTSMKGDHGRILGVRPALLIAPPSLEGQVLELLNAERDAAGATNVWRNTAKWLITPWLA